MVLVQLSNAQEDKSVLLDSRAYLLYTQDEINEMPEYKKAQINFIIRKSFIVPNEMKGKINPDEINGMEYNGYRKENERVKVPLLISKEISNFEYIILLSYKEIDEAYLKIKKQFE